MVKYTFKKEERLCNKRLLSNLFQSGSSFILYPYKITFLKSNYLPSPVQVVISVPKRRFKRSVDRNVLKRRMREAYRLYKHLLYTFVKKEDESLLLSIHYIGKEIIASQVIHKKMEMALLKFRDEYTKSIME